jgi:diguanylate cyclase (GGDEF)-like protein
MRLFAVVATALIIFSTLGALAYSVSGAFDSMIMSADRMDDARALSAAKAALRAMQKQLGGTVRDNAIWDDAYKKIMSPEAVDWATETWASTTADYPLYDTAMVINPDGKPLLAYHSGAALADPDDFYRRQLKDVLQAARRPDPTHEHLPVAFISTREGVALVGASTIQPSAFDPKVNPAELKVLVFSKQITPAVVSEVSHTFNIDGLALEPSAGVEGTLHADVDDLAGLEIAHLTWPAVKPGTASYLRVRPVVLGSGVALVLLLAAIAAVGVAAFKAVRREERASDHKAHHDALTGLLNRAGCLQQLGHFLTRDPHARTSLHILDLDGFKAVNDTWGHPVGDELIQAVALRLVDKLPADALIARLGGDEFAVISQAAGFQLPSSGVPERIQQAVSMPFTLDGRIIEIGGSVGTAAGSNEGIDAAELLRRADLALYRAKDQGRGISVEYDPSLDDEARKSAELEQELRTGLARGDIHTVFQPLIDASTRDVCGVEALARWTSPSRGSVSPEVFIRVAEKAGLIDQLGFEILKTAVREAAQWPEIGVSVNISPLQLRNPYLAAQVRSILAAANFDPRRLTIEVTEGVLISNPDQAKRAMQALKSLGIKIALDDFGCGYASIGALREFGFDRMKIDRSLILALDLDASGGAVLLATIALASALKLPVTAEGIETEDQAAIVKLSGCDELQGYLFGKPVTAKEITDLYFAANRSRGASGGARYAVQPI